MYKFKPSPMLFLFSHSLCDHRHPNYRPARSVRGDDDVTLTSYELKLDRSRVQEIKRRKKREDLKARRSATIYACIAVSRLHRLGQVRPFVHRLQ